MQRTLDEVRAAQRKLMSERRDALTAVGITVRNGEPGLKVNIRHESERETIPASIDGVPVHTVDVTGVPTALAHR